MLLVERHSINYVPVHNYWFSIEVMGLFSILPFLMYATLPLENIEYLVEFRLPALQRKVTSDIIQDDSDSEHD